MSGVSEGRKRLARVVAIFGALALAFVVLRGYQGRAVEATLVHHLPSADQVLPASVEIEIWQGDDLHADAYFPSPASLAELEQSLRVPPGEYRVTYSIFHRYGQPEYRFENEVDIDEAGRYFISYDLEEGIVDGFTPTPEGSQ